MNESRPDGYLVLAVCVAMVAIVSWVVQAVQILQDIDADATSTLAIFSGTASQIAMTMAMVCAVIVGRNMVSCRSSSNRITAQTNQAAAGPDTTAN